MFTEFHVCLRDIVLFVKDNFPSPSTSIKKYLIVCDLGLRGLFCLICLLIDFYRRVKISHCYLTR